VSGLALAALLLVAAWLAVLSLVVILLVRQLSLVTMRLSLVAPHAPADAAGPEVGSAVPQDVSALVGHDGRSTVLILLSATCATCRSLAARVSARELGAETVVLVAGRKPLVSTIAELLPPDSDVRLDPQASRIARGLGLDTVPFGLRLDSGTVSMKAFLHGPDDILRLREGERDRRKPVTNPMRLFRSADRADNSRDVEVGA